MFCAVITVQPMSLTLLKNFFRRIACICTGLGHFAPRSTQVTYRYISCYNQVNTWGGVTCESLVSSMVTYRERGMMICRIMINVQKAAEKIVICIFLSHYLDRFVDLNPDPFGSVPTISPEQNPSDEYQYGSESSQCLQLPYKN